MVVELGVCVAREYDVAVSGDVLGCEEPRKLSGAVTSIETISSLEMLMTTTTVAALVKLTQLTRQNSRLQRQRAHFERTQGALQLTLRLFRMISQAKAALVAVPGIRQSNRSRR